jgi:hypothetical protein
VWCIVNSSNYACGHRYHSLLRESFRCLTPLWWKYQCTHYVYLYIVRNNIVHSINGNQIKCLQLTCFSAAMRVHTYQTSLSNEPRDLWASRQTQWVTTVTVECCRGNHKASGRESSSKRWYRSKFQMWDSLAKEGSYDSYKPAGISCAGLR